MTLMMLKAALDLAQNGWAVLPLAGKTPTTGLTPRGHLNATKNRRQIREWWAGGDWNIGAVVPDSLIVLDVDPRNGGSLRELEDVAGVAMPPTLEVISGRGDGGRHFYFLRPFEQPYRGGIPAGIDLKVNGYCLVPPSVHPASGRPYRWVKREIARLPREVIEMMRPRAMAAHGTTAADVGALAAWVRDAGPGERHNRLHWAARRAHEARVSQRGLNQLIEAGDDVGVPDAARVVASVTKEQNA